MNRLFAIALVLMFTLSSCGLIEGIFKAGMWWGIILVVGVIALIGYVIAKMGGKK